MNILVLSWRDIANPSGGGAEVLTHELAKRWVRYGHNVTVFGASFHGAPAQECVDGVNIVRRGHSWDVHLCAWRHYSKQPPGTFDLILDQCHGLPFGTPLYVRERKALLVCEVAGEIWFQMYPWPVALIGASLERLMLRLYRHVPTYTLAESTRQDLLHVGLAPSQLHILSTGLSWPSTERLPDKTPYPSLIFVGRMCPMKRVSLLLDVVSLLRRRIAGLRLWLVGRGSAYYMNRLRREADRLGCSDAVTFFGYVPEPAKMALLRSAWILISASVREGWGLIINEANALGTPAVVCDVPGYRDSVQHGKTGLLAGHSTAQAMAHQVERLVLDPELYRRLQLEAWQASRSRSWDASSSFLLRAAER